MLSGGDNGAASRSVEAIFPNGTKYCTLPDLPGNRRDHTQDGLTACGGYYTGSEDNCLTLTDGQWTQSHTLSLIRWQHTSWALGDGRVVLMGGYYGQNTTEILSPTSSATTEGFSLKYDTR